MWNENDIRCCEFTIVNHLSHNLSCVARRFCVILLGYSGLRLNANGALWPFCQGWGDVCPTVGKAYLFSLEISPIIWDLQGRSLP
jgi:hypothetical protein